MALITLAEAKEYLRVDTDADDAVIEIGRASCRERV